MISHPNLTTSVLIGVVFSSLNSWYHHVKAVLAGTVPLLAKVYTYRLYLADGAAKSLISELPKSLSMEDLPPETPTTPLLVTRYSYKKGGERERERSRGVSELYGIYPEAVCSTESLLHHFFMCVSVSSPKSKLLIQGISQDDLL